MGLCAGPTTLTPAGHFILEYASYFPDEPRGSTFPNKTPVCTKLLFSADLYLDKTACQKGELV